jgi:hypothetical protein
MEGKMPVKRFGIALMAITTGLCAGFVAYKFIGLFFKN